MDIKLILAIFAILLNIVGGFSVYLFSIFRGTTKPHIYTWLIWTITGVVALLALIRGQGGWGALPLVFSTTFVFVIFLLSFKFGTKNITKFDTIVLAVALLAIVVWFYMHNPLLAVVLVTIADCLGYLPSFRKTFQEPWTESVTSWTVYFFCGLLMILSMNEYNFLTLTYLGVTNVANIILITICLVRRRVVKLSL